MTKEDSYNFVEKFRALTGMVEVKYRRFWSEFSISQSHCSKCGISDSIILREQEIEKLIKALNKIKKEVSQNE